VSDAATWLRALGRRAVEQLKTWDTGFARRALRDFERAYGLDLRAPRVVLADVPTVRRALVPEDRPLIEHHWSTRAPASVDGLARIEALSERVHERADVVGVVWDLVEHDDPTRSPGAVRHRVEEVCADHRAAWPNLVVDGRRDALIEALRLPDAPLPITRVLDADGGVLRTFPGPLTEADVDAVLALVGGA
jgi:hypothetical protein